MGRFDVLVGHFEAAKLSKVYILNDNRVKVGKMKPTRKLRNRQKIAKNSL